MDASYKIQRGIHVHLIQFFMCPEFWVHIKRVMGGIRTPTDIGLMLFCLLLMRIVPSIKLLVCFGNNPHSLIGAAKSVVM